MLPDNKKLLNNTIRIVCSNIAEFCENPSKDFTRNRKLPVYALIQFMLNMEGNSLNAEIYNKLKPEAFKALLYEFNSTFTDAKTLKGLHVYAIDGSDFCTPLNKDSEWYILNHYIRKDGQEAKGTCLLHGNFL